MSTKVFALFRYQILPVTTQFNLMYDVNKIIQMKNKEFFEKLYLFVKDSNFKKNKTYNFNVDRRDDTRILLTVQRRKNIKIINEDKLEEIVDSFPYINVLIDNAPERQIMAVEITKDYTSPKSIVKYINKKINVLLDTSHLIVKISPIYNKSQFWDFVEEHKDKIIRINFEIITPNMSNISHTFSKELKNLAKNTQASSTNLNINAEKGKSLLIDRENEIIAGIVDYSSEGGGEISAKIRDSKLKFNSNDYQFCAEIREEDIKLPLKKISSLVLGMYENNR